MHKLLLVAKETYIRQVKSWSFLFLVLSPFIFIGLSATISYFGAKMTPDDQIAIVSTDKTIQSQLKHHDTFTWKYKSVDDAKKAMKDDKIVGYFYIKSDSQKISANYYGNDEMSSTDEVNIINAGLDKQQLQQLSIQPQYKKHIAKKAVNKKTVQSISYMILSFLMYIVILTYAATTAQEIAAEKGTKIMEVIFSSMSATKYFYGKILGILGVILTHIGIYLLGGIAIYPFIINLDMVSKFKDMIGDILLNLVSVNLIYVVLGIVIYTILAAFFGALVVRVEDTSKAIQPITILIIVSFLSSMVFINNPSSMIVKVLSYVPFLSSFFMPIRVIDNSVSIVEIGISLVILFAITALMTSYISKIYFGLILQSDDVGIWKNFKRGLKFK